MLNSKSNSKKILVTNQRIPNSEQRSTSHVLKRYKSQEVYVITSKKYLKRTSTDVATSKEGCGSTTSSTTNIMKTNLNFFNKNREMCPSTCKSPINSVNKKTLSPIPGNTGSKMASYIQNKPKVNSKMPALSKIMNDESIQELDTEENISLDDNEGLDEMKASGLNTDFYTDKINEGSKSILDKGNKLINNLPQPFVKPLKTQFININLNQDSDDEETLNIKKFTLRDKNDSQMNKKTFKDVYSQKNSGKDLISTTERLLSSQIETPKFEKENSIDIKNEGVQLESLQRKLLISAKKGDRDGFLESLEIILGQEKGDINYKDESGWTALHHACDEGNLKIVDILINTNADINCKTNNKKTPLHLTTAHGYFDISKLLVENGCVINSVDDEKNTPIHICSSTGHLELLKYLLDRFPLADLKNIYGKKPIDLAKKDDIKNLLNDYLKKNESQYTKVPIHSTNQKSVNNFLKNFNPNSTNPNSNYPNYRNTETSPNNTQNTNNNINIKTAPSNCSQKNIKTPIKNFNHPSTPANINMSHTIKNTLGEINTSTKGHTKFQSNDYSNKISTAFQNNSNININISTNINHPSGNINVVNVNNNTSTKQIKINDKVKVTVETQMSPHTSKNSNKQTAHNHAGLKFNSHQTNNQNNKSTIKTPNYKNVASNFNTSRNTTLQNNRILDTENNANLMTAADKNPKIEDLSGKKESSRILKINLNNNSIIEENVNEIKNNEKENETTRVQIVDYSEKYTNEEQETKENTSNNHIEEKYENTRSQSRSQSQTLTQSQTLSQSQNHSVSNPNTTNNKSNTESVEGESAFNCVSIDEERIGPQTFICHALVGKGSFGEVYLVEKRNTKTLYAMKVLSKDKIMAQNLIKYAMTERNVLSITNHPFIVKLNFSFQTSDKLFLILDYCPGGDLAEHLARENRFGEQRAKIYLCEIILALEDLHKRDIIFRDLKPDNVVLDVEGHAQLTDFGLSKEGVLDSKSAKSFCGSIAYLAPEMLKRTGHGKAVDWYLLGVLFYEMLVGIPPYFTNNKEQLFKNIEKAELQIPNFVSPDAQNLLRALLQRDPQFRLGSGKSDAYEIKMHPYFNDVNWTDVYNRKLEPPKPRCRDRVMHKFSTPVVFKDKGSPGVFILNPDIDSHVDGWSFVNTEEQQTSVNNRSNIKKN